MCSDAPDTSGMNEAAVQSAAISADALAFYRQVYDDGKPARDAAAAQATTVSNAQLDSMRQNDTLSKEYADYNRTTFRPLEQGIVADAASFDTPERRQQAAQKAVAGVDSSFARVQEGNARLMSTSGFQPTGARAMAAMGGIGIEQAKAGAAAADKAVVNVETQGLARKMDAASLGRGLAANQATSAGIALNAGNSSVNNGQVPVNLQQSAAGMMGQGFGIGLQGQGQAGSLYGQQASIQQKAGESGGMWGALGQVAGAYAGSAGGSAAITAMLSDENMKKDVAPADPEKALAEVAATPVSTWKYDPAKLAANGIEMAPEMMGENTGPMAQDVAATMGTKAAPGGKKLNPVTMNGKAMLAIQALDKKVNKLAQMIGSGKLEMRAA